MRVGPAALFRGVDGGEKRIAWDVLVEEVLRRDTDIPVRGEGEESGWFGGEGGSGAE